MYPVVYGNVIGWRKHSLRGHSPMSGGTDCGSIPTDLLGDETSLGNRVVCQD